MRKVKVDSIFTLNESSSKDQVQQLNTSSTDSVTKYSNLIYIHFLFQYYCLISPFRLKKVEDGKFEIHSWIPQKILCGFVLFLALLDDFTDIRSDHYNLRENRPVTFLALFADISEILFRITVYWGLFRNQKAYLKLANFFGSLPPQNLFPYNCKKITSSLFLIVVHLFYIILATSIWIRFIGYPNELNYWSLTWIYRSAVRKGRYKFFMENDMGNSSTVPDLSEIKGVDHLVGVLHALSYLFAWIMARIGHAYVLVHVWTLWAPVVSFANEKHQQLRAIRWNGYSKDEETGFDGSYSDKVMEFNQTFEQFLALKDLSILVREAIGNTLLAFVCMAVFSYSITLDSILLNRSILERITYSFNFASVLCIFIFSAEIVRKVNWLKTWLYEGGGEVADQHKLGVLLEGIADNAVGISGAGIFKINYSFLGTVGGLLITYFIISLQDRN